tara:strand:+ start:36723 stop:37643 length:921 start_codon:yes stop_codon:yes gene_type:complete
MNLIKDFTSTILELEDDYEGKVTATLVSSNFNVGNRKSVLYIHGYIDYFFHPHLAEQFIDHGFDFYALDLRKYGRSLLNHQHPNYCRNLDEYFEEISIAIRKIKESNTSIYLLGHSTGGLITSNYMNDGEEKDQIAGLILNSPFFDFNQSKLRTFISLCVAKIISALSPYSKIEGALSPTYPKSIHKDYHGDWDFNLKWKPINGFPTYFKWVSAIGKAQKKLAHSNITAPILLMHSSGSKKLIAFSEEATLNDLVLDIEDMKRVGKNLGNEVSFVQINHAMHDIFLSSKKVRDAAFKKMFEWLDDH